MGKQRKSPGAASAKPQERASVTPERFTRLYRFVKLLQSGAQTRSAIVKKLKFDVRGFYRDLELLRESGIEIEYANRRYALTGDAQGALGKLPFPDPMLTLGEAEALARGRTALHKRLTNLIGKHTK